ncbi:hypothetical protein [Okeania sp.]|uniref:hypothetical protein n=1 Tax=Okeania sp. TaxID=3100323 RepID=UPI002B4B723A|nr:hypothetical protein [Okeania sp.]MEB3340330.1 hypothetical protein [Okeania sp.]
MTNTVYSKAVTFVNTSCKNDIFGANATIYNRLKPADINGNIELIGKDIVLKKDDNNYFDKLTTSPNSKISSEEPKVKFKNLIIACDVLEIYDELIVPECNVSIFARKLIVKSGGCINTSPLPWDQPHAKNADSESDEIDKAKARDGANGRHAGNVNLFVRDLKIENKNNPNLKIENENNPIIKANGGNGQDAGEGMHGKDGHSVEKYYDHDYVRIDNGHDAEDLAHFNFDPPATYYEWESRFMMTTYPMEYVGSKDEPTSGTNAKKPGKPGSPGNGGNIISNQSNQSNQSLHYELKPGEPGKKALYVNGGEAGIPTKSGQYKILVHRVLHFWNKTEYLESDITTIKTTKTKKGTSYEAPDADKKDGEKGTYQQIESTNAWLHPKQLQIILQWARDEYLKNPTSIEKIEEILEVYSDALKKDVPNEDSLKIWNERSSKIMWSKGKQRINSLLIQIAGNKDYFNNPAGYMPVLSLNTTIKLYENSIEDALKSLVFAKLVSNSYNKAIEEQNFIKKTTKDIESNSEELENNIKEVEKELETVDSKIDVAKRKLDKLSTKLADIETRLKNEASKDENKKAQITFGLKMGAALLQLIPYGQPVLGVVGKMTSTIADNRGEDFTKQFEGVKDVFSENKESLENVLKKIKEGIQSSKKATNEIATRKRSNAIILSEKPEVTIPGQSEEVKPEEKKNEESVSQWSYISKNLSSPISDVIAGFRALSVPESKILAQADQLKTQDEEWNQTITEIKEFTKEKTELFREYLATLELLSNLSYRLQENTFMSLKLGDEAITKTGAADPDLLDFALELENRSQEQLIYQLYLMTKAYETTAFEKSEISWHRDNLFDKIIDNIKDKPFEDLDKTARELSPIFTQNLNKIKQKTLNFLTEKRHTSHTFNITISDQSNPSLMKQLRTEGEISFNPFDFGHIRPKFHYMKFQTIAEINIHFKDKNSQTSLDLLKSNNTYPQIIIKDEGVVRVNDEIYMVRSIPRILTWSIRKGKKDEEPEPEKEKLRLDSSNKIDQFFQTVIGDTTGEKCQHLALPPAWSDMKFQLNNASSEKLLENLESLELTLEYEVVDTPRDGQGNQKQCVIDLRSPNAPGASFEISGLSQEKIQVVGQYYAITKQHKKIEITASKEANELKFLEWNLVTENEKVIIKEKTISVDLSDQKIRNKLLRIECVYGTEAQERERERRHTRAVCKPLGSTKDFEDMPPIEDIAFTVGVDGVAAPDVENFAIAGVDGAGTQSVIFELQALTLYSEPDDDSPVIDCVEEDMLTSYNDEGEDIPSGWAKVTTDRLTGFVKKEDVAELRVEPHGVTN